VRRVVKDHRFLTDVAELYTTHLLNARMKITIVDKSYAHRLRLVLRLLRELRESDEDAIAHLQSLARERACKLANLVDAYTPSSPALALNDLALAGTSQLKIDVAVRLFLAAFVSDLPPFTLEHLSNEPFELLGGEKT